MIASEVKLFYAHYFFSVANGHFASVQTMKKFISGQITEQWTTRFGK